MRAAVFYRAIYRASYQSLRPYVSYNLSSSLSLVHGWARLVLPCVGPSGTVEKFLVGNVAQGGYTPQGDEWLKIHRQLGGYPTAD